MNCNAPLSGDASLAQNISLQMNQIPENDGISRRSTSPQNAGLEDDYLYQNNSSGSEDQKNSKSSCNLGQTTELQSVSVQNKPLQSDASSSFRCNTTSLIVRDKKACEETVPLCYSPIYQTDCPVLPSSDNSFVAERSPVYFPPSTFPDNHKMLAKTPVCNRKLQSGSNNSSPDDCISPLKSSGHHEMSYLQSFADGNSPVYAPTNSPKFSFNSIPQCDFGSPKSTAMVPSKCVQALLSNTDSQEGASICNTSVSCSVRESIIPLGNSKPNYPNTSTSHAVMSNPPAEFREAYGPLGVDYNSWYHNTSESPPVRKSLDHFNDKKYPAGFSNPIYKSGNPVSTAKDADVCSDDSLDIIEVEHNVKVPEVITLADDSANEADVAAQHEKPTLLKKTMEKQRLSNGKNTSFEKPAQHMSTLSSHRKHKKLSEYQSKKREHENISSRTVKRRTLSGTRSTRRKKSSSRRSRVESKLILENLDAKPPPGSIGELLLQNHTKRFVERVIVSTKPSTSSSHSFNILDKQYGGSSGANTEDEEELLLLRKEALQSVVQVLDQRNSHLEDISPLETPLASGSSGSTHSICNTTVNTEYSDIEVSSAKPVVLECQDPIDMEISVSDLDESNRGFDDIDLREVGDNINIPIEWAYMIPPPASADQKNDILNFKHFSFGQNLCKQAMESSYMANCSQSFVRSEYPANLANNQTDDNSMEPSNGTAFQDDATTNFLAETSYFHSNTLSFDSLPLAGSSNLPHIGSSNFPHIGSSNLSHTGSSNLSHTGSSNLSHTGSSNLLHAGSVNLPPAGSVNLPPAGSVNLPNARSTNLHPSGSGNLCHSESGNLTYSGSGNLAYSESGNLTHSESGHLTHSERGNLSLSGSDNLHHTGCNNLPLPNYSYDIGYSSMPRGPLPQHDVTQTLSETNAFNQEAFMDAVTKNKSNEGNLIHIKIQNNSLNKNILNQSKTRKGRKHKSMKNLFNNKQTFCSRDDFCAPNAGNTLQFVTSNASEKADREYNMTRQKVSEASDQNVDEDETFLRNKLLQALQLKKADTESNLKYKQIDEQSIDLQKSINSGGTSSSDTTISHNISAQRLGHILVDGSVKDTAIAKNSVGDASVGKQPILTFRYPKPIIINLNDDSDSDSMQGSGSGPTSSNEDSSALQSTIIDTFLKGIREGVSSESGNAASTDIAAVVTPQVMQLLGRPRQMEYQRMQLRMQEIQARKRKCVQMQNRTEISAEQSTASDCSTDYSQTDLKAEINISAAQNCSPSADVSSGLTNEHINRLPTLKDNSPRSCESDVEDLRQLLLKNRSKWNNSNTKTDHNMIDDTSRNSDEDLRNFLQRNANQSTVLAESQIRESSDTENNSSGEPSDIASSFLANVKSYYREAWKKSESCENESTSCPLEEPSNDSCTGSSDTDSDSSLSSNSSNNDRSQSKKLSPYKNPVCGLSINNSFTKATLVETRSTGSKCGNSLSNPLSPVPSEGISTEVSSSIDSDSDSMHSSDKMSLKRIPTTYLNTAPFADAFVKLVDGEGTNSCMNETDCKDVEGQETPLCEVSTFQVKADSVSETVFEETQNEIMPVEQNEAPDLPLENLLNTLKSLIRSDSATAPSPPKVTMLCGTTDNIGSATSSHNNWFLSRDRMDKENKTIENEYGNQKSPERSVVDETRVSNQNFVNSNSDSAAIFINKKKLSLEKSVLLDELKSQRTHKNLTDINDKNKMESLKSLTDEFLKVQKTVLDPSNQVAYHSEGSSNISSSEKDGIYVNSSCTADHTFTDHLGNTKAVKNPSNDHSGNSTVLKISNDHPTDEFAAKIGNIHPNNAISEKTNKDFHSNETAVRTGNDYQCIPNAEKPGKDHPSNATADIMGKAQPCNTRAEKPDKNHPSNAAAAKTGKDNPCIAFAEKTGEDHLSTAAGEKIGQDHTSNTITEKTLIGHSNNAAAETKTGEASIANKESSSIIRDDAERKSHEAMLSKYELLFQGRRFGLEHLKKHVLRQSAMVTTSERECRKVLAAVERTRKQLATLEAQYKTKVTQQSQSRETLVRLMTQQAADTATLSKLHHKTEHLGRQVKGVEYRIPGSGVNMTPRRFGDLSPRADITSRPLKRPSDTPSLSLWAKRSKTWVNTSYSVNNSVSWHQSRTASALQSDSSNRVQQDLNSFNKYSRNNNALSVPKKIVTSSTCQSEAVPSKTVSSMPAVSTGVGQSQKVFNVLAPRNQLKSPKAPISPISKLSKVHTLSESELRDRLIKKHKYSQLPRNDCSDAGAEQVSSNASKPSALCPYDLLGTCHDENCSLEHLTCSTPSIVSCSSSKSSKVARSVPSNTCHPKVTTPSASLFDTVTMGLKRTSAGPTKPLKKKCRVSEGDTTGESDTGKECVLNAGESDACGESKEGASPCHVLNEKSGVPAATTTSNTSVDQLDPAGEAEQAESDTDDSSSDSSDSSSSDSDSDDSDSELSSSDIGSPSRSPAKSAVSMVDSREAPCSYRKGEQVAVKSVVAQVAPLALSTQVDRPDYRGTSMREDGIRSCPPLFAYQSEFRSGHGRRAASISNLVGHADVASFDLSKENLRAYSVELSDASEKYYPHTGSKDLRNCVEKIVDINKGSCTDENVQYCSPESTDDALIVSNYDTKQIDTEEQNQKASLSAENLNESLYFDSTENFENPESVPFEVEQPEGQDEDEQKGRSVAVEQDQKCNAEETLEQPVHVGPNSIEEYPNDRSVCSVQSGKCASEKTDDPSVSDEQPDETTL